MGPKPKTTGMNIPNERESQATIPSEPRENIMPAKGRPFGFPFGNGTNPGGTPADPTLLMRWIEETKKGELWAFQRIYDLFSRKVLNFIYRMVASIEEAEVLTQETFVTVYQKLGSLKDNAKFAPWLFRIARNHVYQRYRRHTPAMVSVDIQDEDGHPAVELPDKRKDPQKACQAGECEEVVRRVIHDLPDKYREVFILSAIHDLSYQVIADIVGRSLSSVKTDIHRARLQVRGKVKDYLKGSLGSTDSMISDPGHRQSRFLQN